MTEYIKPDSRGKTFCGEAKDCTVRALANASGMEYGEAHDLMRIVGKRVNRNGGHLVNYGKAYLVAGAKNVKFYGKRAKTESKYVNGSTVTGEGMSIGKFLESKPVGRFVVLIAHHATCVIDGRIVDTELIKKGSHIRAIFEFPQSY